MVLLSERWKNRASQGRDHTKRPSSLTAFCRDKSHSNSCGATRLGANCAHSMHTYICRFLLTENHLRRAYCWFGLPSGAHSFRPSLPHSHRQRLSTKEASKSTYSPSTVSTWYVVYARSAGDVNPFFKKKYYGFSGGLRMVREMRFFVSSTSSTHTVTTSPTRTASLGCLIRRPPNWEI